MPGTFSPPAWVNDPDMHHGTCVTHVPWCMPGSLTCGFLWSWCREKPSRHSRRMRYPQFYVSGKRPIVMEVFGRNHITILYVAGSLLWMALHHDWIRIYHCHRQANNSKLKKYRSYYITYQNNECLSYACITKWKRERK